MALSAAERRALDRIEIVLLAHDPRLATTLDMEAMRRGSRSGRTRRDRGQGRSRAGRWPGHVVGATVSPGDGSLHLVTALAGAAGLTRRLLRRVLCRLHIRRPGTDSRGPR